MIKVISFDLGGVLFSDGSKIAPEKLNEFFNYDKNVVWDIIHTPQSIDMRKGLLTDGEFWSWAQDSLPVGCDVQKIKRFWYESYVLNDDIFDLIKNLKKDSGCKIVAFSDNIKSRIDYLDQKYDFRKLFDKEVYSFDYHFDKGEEKASKYLLQEVGCSPGDILHIDDNSFVSGLISQAGMQTIIYDGDIKGLKYKLRELGIKF